MENNDFEMIIENVFDIKNHGVVVTGIIKSGVIHLNDEVIINNEKYTVTQSDVIPNQVTQAQKGMDAGLHLDTVNAALFKRGDIVSAKCFADSEEPEPKVDI